MKTEKQNYVVPTLEIIEVEMEKGYAVSQTGSNESFGSNEGAWS